MATWRHAFSLSKEELRDSEPPGTVRLVEHELHRTPTGTTVFDGDHIVLLPKPSSSPADPLNWPLSRRYAILFTMCFYALAADFAAGAVAPALTIIQFQFVEPNLSLGKLTQLVSVSTLLLGTSNIFWVPLGNIFGRRPIIIVSLLFLLLTTIWCGLADSYPSLLAARALQGASSGPVYTFAPEITGEIFFLHERGRTLVFYTMCLAAGPFVGGVAGGYIAGNLGYRYLFWISAALVGFTLLLEVFIVPETLFDREHHLRQDEQADEGNDAARQEKGDSTMKENFAVSERAPPPAWSYVQSLKCGMYRGNIVQHFLAPWLSLAFPGTWVVMLHYGGLVAAIITTATVGPIFLSQPPYLWGADVGLINFGGLVGVALGGILTYFTADWLSTRRAKHDSHGFFEPESRIPAMFPGLILAFGGLLTFGFSAANPTPNAWAGLAVGGGMITAATTIVTSIGFNYLIDSYNPLHGDSFVMTTITRAVISFAWTFFVADWLVADLPTGERVISMLNNAGFNAKPNPTFEWIHDTYLILIRMFPDRCPPTTLLSLNARFDPHFHMRVGATIASLRSEGYLIIGTGGAVHNLYRNRWAPMLKFRDNFAQETPPEDWALEFRQSVEDCFANNRGPALRRAITRLMKHPQYRDAHASDDHFMSACFVAGAAGGWDDVGEEGGRLEAETWELTNMCNSQFTIGSWGERRAVAV